MDHRRSSESQTHECVLTSLVFVGVGPFVRFECASWFTKVRKGVARGDSTRGRSRLVAANRPRRIQSPAGDVTRRQSERRPGSSRRIRPSATLLLRPNTERAMEVLGDTGRRLPPAANRVGARILVMIDPRWNQTAERPSPSLERRCVVWWTVANGFMLPAICRIVSTL